MRNYIICAILLVFLPWLMPLQAQEPVGQLPLGHLTLDEAIAWSLNHSPVLTIGRLKLQQDDQELSRIQRSKIPDIYLSGDFRRNLVVPTTPIPAYFLNPNADPGQLLYMKFNTGWNSGAGINFSVDIFNPASYNRSLDQKIQNKINSYDLNISETGKRAEIAKAYAACVISQDQLESVKSDTLFYHESLIEAKVLYDQHKISLTDRNNIVIAYNTSIMQFWNAGKVLSESRTNLLYLLGEEITNGKLDSLHLSENIPALYEKMIPSVTEYSAANQISGAEMTGSGLSRQSEVVALARNRVKSSRLKIAPSLSLNAFYGANYYSNDFNPGNGDLWHGNSFVAMSLKVPLTQAFSTSRETARLKLQEQIETENLQDMQNLKSKELNDGRNRLSISVQEYEMLRQNYELGKENLNAFRARLDRTYIQEKDYLEEQVRCRNSYQRFLQAAYNVFINTIDLQKMKAE
ncbi:MAG TPA: TolC family protein [Prolixibacteraceae bacterium]|nr:TolC family protein [Prolixibacteraceae bacterium]